MERRKQMPASGRTERTSTTSNAHQLRPGADGDNQGRGGPDKIPLHETAYQQHYLRNRSLSHGIGNQINSGQQGVRNPRGTARTGFFATTTGPSEEGHTATQPARPEAASVLATLSLSLNNQTNICYLNATICAVTWSVLQATATGGGSTLFGKASHAWQAILQGPRVQTIPSHTHWKSILRQWPGLHQQQDAAEFVNYLQRVCQIPSMSGTWSARLQTYGTVQVNDRGLTHCINMQLPIAENITLQTIIHDWAEQYSLHALDHPAQVIVIRLDRCRNGPTGVQKVRSRVTHAAEVQIPCFVRGGIERRGVLYRVSALVVHHGDSPRSGHYTTRLITRQGDTWATEDGRPATRGGENTFPYESDGYLYMLRRSD